MSETNKITKEDLIRLVDETVEYYKTNPRGLLFYTKKVDGRNQTVKKGCTYADGDRCCAVGRLFSDDEKKTFGDYPSGVAYMVLHFEGIVPDVVLDYPTMFLTLLQRLHDTDLNWVDNDSGGCDLTPEGIDEVNSIKDNIDDIIDKQTGREYRLEKGLIC